MVTKKGLLLTDKTDALIDEGKSKPSYVNAYERAAKELAPYYQATAIDGLEPLLVRLILQKYDEAHIGIMSHGFTLSDSKQTRQQTSEALKLARSAKAALRSYRRNTLSDEQVALINEVQKAVAEAHEELANARRRAEAARARVSRRNTLVGAILIGVLALVVIYSSVQHAPAKSAVAQSVQTPAPTPTSAPVKRRR
jgi:hypothetical protein